MLDIFAERYGWTIEYIFGLTLKQATRICDAITERNRKLKELYEKDSPSGKPGGRKPKAEKPGHFEITDVRQLIGTQGFKVKKVKGKRAKRKIYGK